MEYTSGEWWVCFRSHIYNMWDMICLVLDSWSFQKIFLREGDSKYVLNYWHIKFQISIFAICTNIQKMKCTLPIIGIRWMNDNQIGLFDAQKFIVFFYVSYYLASITRVVHWHYYRFYFIASGMDVKSTYQCKYLSSIHYCY
jgi:hypothetical protein